MSQREKYRQFPLTLYRGKGKEAAFRVVHSIEEMEAAIEDEGWSEKSTKGVDYASHTADHLNPGQLEELQKIRQDREAAEAEERRQRDIIARAAEMIEKARMSRF